MIAAHFFDVESGRKDLDDRGHSRAHEQFDIPIPRDGGIQDLLAEAERPDRRFVAVICESISRVARRTYFGTKIEHELEQAGVVLLAADEPIPTRPQDRQRSRKRAGPILTRRINQAIAEWYVVQLLELSWDGVCEHTEQGWNIGRAPYGYRADRRPHPVPARRAEGKTKSRLVPDPETGPVVTKIFHLRALERLGYDTIADRLNADLANNPPPRPVDPRRAVGRWTGSAVRGVLANPKYTGYMVWNRRATKKGGHCNPPGEWVWSRIPTHEPLVTQELFEVASPIGRQRQGSRVHPELNSHPDSKRSYRLRSYVVCDLCDRRMFGRTRRRYGYFACQPERHHHQGRARWYPQHPKSLWVREDALLDAVRDFFAERIFGAKRHELLRQQLTTQVAEPSTSPAQARRAQLSEELAELKRRQDNLLAQLEEQQATGDPDADREYRAGIQRRFAALVADRRSKQDEKDRLASPALQTPQLDTGLLAKIPQISANLAELPEDMERRLYDAFQLQIRYNRPRHEAVVRVTIREDTMTTVTSAIKRIANPDGTTKDPCGHAEALFPCSVCPQPDPQNKGTLFPAL